MSDIDLPVDAVSREVPAQASYPAELDSFLPLHCLTRILIRPVWWC